MVINPTVTASSGWTRENGRSDLASSRWSITGQWQQDACAVSVAERPQSKQELHLYVQGAH
jgi:hypothetical protein